MGRTKKSSKGARGLVPQPQQQPAASTSASVEAQVDDLLCPSPVFLLRSLKARGACLSLGLSAQPVAAASASLSSS